MGGKQATMWKHFCVCLALFVILGWQAGCTAINKIGANGMAEQHLAQAEQRLAARDFDGALAESEEVLSWTADRKLRQKALLNMAIVYSHQDSRQRNNEKAAEIFKTLAESNPKTSFADYAEIWISLRQANLELTDENRKLKQIIEKIKQIDLEIEQKRRK